MQTQRPRRRPSPQAGFTLLEALIASSIFLMILYAVYTVYDVGEASYKKGSRKWDVQSQSRVALERMGREIRTAGYASPTKAADPVVIATNDTISIHADVGNGLQYITYSRRDCSGNVGTTLYRRASTVGAPLATAQFCGGDAFADNVTALTFTYYEINNVPLPYPLTATYQLDTQDPVTTIGAVSAPAVGGQRDRVRQVKISITIQQTVGSQTVPFTATTDVALRNFL